MLKTNRYLVNRDQTTTAMIAEDGLISFRNNADSKFTTKKFKTTHEACIYLKLLGWSEVNIFGREVRLPVDPGSQILWAYND